MILTKSNIKSIDLDNEIKNRIASSKLNELLLVVPTNRKVRNLKREFISNSPKQTATKLFIETLGTLTSKMLSSKKNYLELSEAASTVFIKQSCDKVDLKYFTNYKKEIPAGTLDRLMNVISEYKNHGITPEVLRKEAEELEGSEQLKAIDIANIYEVFRKKCLSLNAFDAGDVYYELRQLNKEELQKSFRAEFPDSGIVIIRGFDELTDPEISIINHIAEISDLELFIEFDYSKDNFGIFSHLNECYGKLIKTGFKAISSSNKNEETKFKSDLISHLYQFGTTPIDYSNSIETITSQTREEEIKNIAKEIKRLIVEENVEPSSIAVGFNLIQNYTHLVRDIFSVYNIPINLTDRIRLSNAFPVSAVIHFLEILESDYYYKNILRSLNSGFIKVDDIDSFNLERTAAELKIVAGKYSWKSKITEALKYCSDDDIQGQRKIARYNKALSDIDKIADLLKPFEKKITLQQFQDEMIILLQKLKVDKSLLEESYGNEEVNIKALTTFIVTINEIFSLFEIECGKDKEFNINFFLEQIRTASGWARFNIKERSNYGVQITSLNELRGLKYDYLFIAGMCDGDFPTRYNPEIFFSGSYVRKENQHQAEERFRFYQALLAFQKKLYLSYPLTDNEKDVVESSLLKEFKKAFTVSEFDKSKFDTAVFSKEDLLKKYGRREVPNNESAADELDTESIDKKLEIDKLRQDQSDQNIFNGFLLSGEKDKSVNNELSKLKDNVYSITQLEEYAKCPFSYFLSRVLRLEIIEEPTEEIEALEMGSLLHSILFEFYSTARDKHIIMQSCSDEVFEIAEKLMFEIAEKKLNDASFTQPQAFYEREKLLGLSGNPKASILYKFLEEERKPSEYIPKYFEVSFGKLKDDESDKDLTGLENIDINGVKLRGKIDRIDLNSKDDSFNVTDYKSGGTGSKPSKADLEEGISLQLPVYLHVAKKLIEANLENEFYPNDMKIFSMKYNVDHFKQNVVSLTRKRNVSLEEKIDLNNQLIESTNEKIKQYVESISTGNFGLSQLPNREEKACKFCDFGTICRVSETN